MPKTSSLFDDIPDYGYFQIKHKTFNFDEPDEEPQIANPQITEPLNITDFRRRLRASNIEIQHFIVHEKSYGDGQFHCAIEKAKANNIIPEGHDWRIIRCTPSSWLPYTVEAAFTSLDEAEAALPMYRVREKHTVEATLIGLENDPESSDRPNLRTVNHFHICRHIGQGANNIKREIAGPFTSFLEAYEHMISNPQAIMSSPLRDNYEKEETEPNPEFDSFYLDSTTETTVFQRQTEKDLDENINPGHDVSLGFIQFMGGFREVTADSLLEPQDLRQLANITWEAISDLGQAISKPSSAISLDGRLSLNLTIPMPGKKAAHFDPLTNTLSLSLKPNQGNLFAEWFRALDTQLGRTLHSKSPGEYDQLSYIRPNPQSPHYDLIQSLYYAQTDVPYDINTCKAQERQQHKNLLQQLNHTVEKHFPLSILQLEDISTLDSIKSELEAGTNLHQQIERLNTLRTNVYGPLDPLDKSPLENLIQAIKLYRRKQDDYNKAINGETWIKSIPSDYRNAAAEADANTGRQYHIRPTEMAARAFSIYARDQLKSHNIQNPFLDPQADFDGKDGPYPSGEEKEKIKNVMVKFLDRAFIMLENHQAKANDPSITVKEPVAEVIQKEEVELPKKVTRYPRFQP